MVFTKLFSRRWWLATILVVVGMGVLVRLGFWQLDRLEQRRDFNNYVFERWTQEPFPVTSETLSGDLDAITGELDYRRVQATGEYDYENQIVLKNQIRDNRSQGVNLLTPLVLEDGKAILIARGWVPYDQGTPENWGQFDESSAEPIVGLLQESQTLPNGNAVTVPDTPQVGWFYVSIPAIQAQMPYELLPMFILQLPEADRLSSELPFREEPIRLDEGSHLSYSIQWFMFALIFGFGYISYVRYYEDRSKRIAEKTEAMGEQAEDESSEEIFATT